MKYIHSKPEKRKKLLVTLVRKMIVQEDYYQIQQDVSTYATENNISKEQVTLANVDYPEYIEW